MERRANVQDTPTAPLVQRGADTIDALLAPIELEETTGPGLDRGRRRLSGVEIPRGVTEGSGSELVEVVGRCRFATRSSALAPSITDGLQLLTSVAATVGDDGPGSRRRRMAC